MNLFGPGNCCCGGCNLYVDDFQRADSADVGGTWTEVQGDWEIDSNAVITAATAGLLISSRVPNRPAFRIGVLVLITDSENKLRLVFNYVDEDNYLFVEIHWTDDTQYFLSIAERVAGVETLLASREDPVPVIIVGQAQTIDVCCQPDLLRVSHSADSLMGLVTDADGVPTTFVPGISTFGIAHPITADGDLPVGLGTGDVVNEIIVDDWRIVRDRPMSQLPEDTVCGACEPTCIVCQDEHPANVMQIVITGGAVAGTYLLPYNLYYHGSAANTRSRTNWAFGASILYGAAGTCRSLGEWTLQQIVGSQSIRLIARVLYGTFATAYGSQTVSGYVLEIIAYVNTAGLDISMAGVASGGITTHAAYAVGLGTTKPDCLTIDESPAFAYSIQTGTGSRPSWAPATLDVDAVP
jgi:hypothetical protein